MQAEEFEIAASGVCGGDDADALYAWDRDRWNVRYVARTGELLGTDRSPSEHPSIALLRLEHEARLVDVLLAFLWEGEGTVAGALGGSP